MTGSGLTPALYLGSTAVLLLATVFSANNYRNTRRLSRYWLFVALTTFTIAAWAGSYLLNSATAGMLLPGTGKIRSLLALTALTCCVCAMSQHHTAARVITKIT